VAGAPPGFGAPPWAYVPPPGYEGSAAAGEQAYFEGSAAAGGQPYYEAPPAFDAPPPAFDAPPYYEAPPPAFDAPPYYEAPPPAFDAPPYYEAPPPAADAQRYYEAPPPAADMQRYYEAPPPAADMQRYYEAPPPGYSPPPGYNARPGHNARPSLYTPPRYETAPPAASKKHDRTPPKRGAAPASQKKSRAGILAVVLSLGSILVIFGILIALFYVNQVAPGSGGYVIEPARPAPPANQPPDTARISLDMPGSGGEFIVNGETEFLFMPDTSGTWELFTKTYGDSDPFLELRGMSGNLLMFDDDSGGGFDARMVVDLLNSQQYTILAGSLAYGSCSFTLYVNLMDQSTSAPAGETTEEWGDGGLIPGSGGEFRVVGETVFVFVPDDPGPWIFLTSNCGNSDPYLSLYNAEGELLASNDDGGGDGVNSLITIELEAGASYFLIAEFYHGTGSYDLTVALE